MERYGYDFEPQQYAEANVDPDEVRYWQKRAADGNDTQDDRAQHLVDGYDQQVFNSQPDDPAVNG
jgi:hypothetical protein